MAAWSDGFTPTSSGLTSTRPRSTLSLIIAHFGPSADGAHRARQTYERRHLTPETLQRFVLQAQSAVFGGNPIEVPKLRVI